MLKFRNSKITAGAALLFLLAILWGLSGCQTNDLAEAEGDRITYLVRNPLVVDEIILDDYTTNSEGRYLGKLKISGLKDQAIQDKINQKIEALCTQAQATKVPPYRGILHGLTDENEDPQITGVFMNVRGNSNNILSISAYVDGTVGERFFSEVLTLNVDLNTGEEITLRDLFKDGADYLSIFNDAIAEELEQSYFIQDEYANIRQVAPFKGIDDTQKFIISEQGIELILNHQNSEFYFPYFQTYQLTCGFERFGTDLLIDSKYYDPKVNLYESEELPERILLRDQSRTKTVTIEIPDTPENIRAAVQYTYPQSAPASLIERAAKLAVLDHDNFDLVLSGGEENPEYGYYYNKDVSCYKVGNYYNITTRESYFVKDYWYTNAQNEVYDLAANRISLGDLFTAGFDYESAFKDAIEQSISESFRATTDDGERIEMIEEEYNLEELFESGSFAIDGEYISFYTRPLLVSMQGPESDYRTNVYKGLPYQEIGYDHLTIFN